MWRSPRLPFCGWQDPSEPQRAPLENQKTRNMDQETSQALPGPVLSVSQPAVGTSTHHTGREMAGASPRRKDMSVEIHQTAQGLRFVLH